MKVLMNHIYEYKKGVRRMVLFTFNKKYEDFAIRRLKSQNIKYIIQSVGNDRLNLYFGREECLNAIRMIVTRPLNLLLQKKITCSVPCWAMIFAHNVRDTASAKARVYTTEKHTSR